MPRRIPTPPCESCRKPKVAPSRIAASVSRLVPRETRPTNPEQHPSPYHRRTPSTTPAAHGPHALEGQTPLHRSPHSTSSSREVSTLPTSPGLPPVLRPPLLLPSLSREMWRGWSGLVARRETPHQPQEQTPEQGEGGGRGLACFIWHASCYSTDRASPDRGGGEGVLQPCPVPHVWRRYNGKPPPTTSGQRLPVDLARSVPATLLPRVSVR